jgi:hypothetical protein
MRNIINYIWALGLGITITACEHSDASVNTKAKIEKEQKDPNAGKHKLAKQDPRHWQTYPIIVLVATKHSVGIDTARQLIQSFEERFNDLGQHTFLSQLDVMFPVSYKYYEEGTPSMADDAAYFKVQGKRYGLATSVVANIIADFYLIGGSNREYPDPSAK